jgi:HK97 family phage portal protein
VYRDTWDVDKAVREGMQRITWVFRAVHVRASKSAGLPVIVRRGDPEDGDEVDHPLLPLLNSYSVPRELDRTAVESAYVFRYRVSAITDLSRMGCFIEVQRSKVGDPIALRILPPGNTFPIPGTGSDFLDGYEVRVQGLDPMRLDPDEVIWVKHPHPSNPYIGMTPMEAAGIAIDTEWAAKVYQRQFLRNDARGGGILLVAGDISHEDIDELQSRIDARSGPSSAGRWTVMEATMQDVGGESTGEVGGIKAIDTSISPREAAYMEMRKYGKEEIFGAFGMSSAMGTGDASQRTYENIDAEYLMFWRDTMIDHNRLLYRPFDLIDEDPDTFVGVDTSSVAVLRRDKMEYERHLLALRADGSIVWNEVREELGREPYAEGGDVVYQPLTQAPTAGLEALEEPTGATPSATPPAPAPPPLTASVLARLHPETKSQDATVAFGPWRVDAKRLANRRRERQKRLIAWERQATKVMQSFFKRQQAAVVEKLRGRKAREGTRHWVEEGRLRSQYTKGIDPKSIFDRRKWDEQLSRDVSGIVEAVAEDFGEETFDDIHGAKRLAGAETKQDESFDATNPRLIAFILARGNKIKDANQTTFESIARVLAEGDQAGDTIDDLAKRVAGVFDAAIEGRARVIARTEVLSAANMGAMEAARQSEVVESKSWLATDDERTRPDHAEADGQTVPLEDPFIVGGVELAHPGDPNGPPEQTINCFPADTLVQSPRLERAYRRRYSGPMVTARTGRGGVLTGTPNHPVLTVRGWIPLGLLRKGDYLVSASLAERMATGDPNVEDSPTEIGEAFAALLPASHRERMIGDARDFHGDGRYGDVDVVTPYRVLRETFKSSGTKHPEQDEFVFANQPTSVLVGSGARFQTASDRSGRVVPASTGQVGSRNLPLPLVGRHTQPLHSLSIRTAARRNALLQQAPSYDTSIYSQYRRESLLRLASDIAADEVVYVEIESFVGDVFNLQTATGWYLAGPTGIVAHNCRCVATFAVEGGPIL